MSRGKRYDDEPKLNLKKVFGTIITIAVIIMIIISINKILNRQAEQVLTGKVEYFVTYLDGKWGVIDSNGTTVIQNKYNEVINSKYLDDILDAGNKKMQEIFKSKYEDMKRKIGLSR